MNNYKLIFEYITVLQFCEKLFQIRKRANHRRGLYNDIVQYCWGYLMHVLSVIEYFYHIRSVMATLSSQETELGEIENHAINEELTRSKRKPQCKYSDEDRYIIAKYAKERFIKSCYFLQK